MDMEILEQYCSKFEKLHPNRVRNGAGRLISAPHKSVLLLSVMDLIGNGLISDNEIVLSDQLEHSFDEHWDVFVSESQRDVGFRPDTKKPFYHLKNLGKPWQKEPFWHHEPEISDFRDLKMVRYAYLDEELFKMMQSEKVREQLTEVLKETYFSESP